jgi:hypothetical protein
MRVNFPPWMGVFDAAQQSRSPGAVFCRKTERQNEKEKATR